MSRTFHHSHYGKRHFFKLSNRIGPTPMWWVREFMNRPQRHSDRALMRKVLIGRVDADGAAFGTGNRKPHVYFW